MSVKGVYIEAMMKRTMGNKALARLLFKKLFSELPLDIKALKKAIMQNKMPVAQKITHKLQGTFSFCGFSKLEILTKHLENIVCYGDLGKSSMSFDDLEREITLFNHLQDCILKKLG
jgi:chemotaxis protein histidine kinase CheA